MRTSVLVAVIAIAVAVLASVLFAPKFDPKSMAGKRVVVTGASQGIGEQMAYELAKMKAKVVIVARSKDKMERIVKKCRDMGAPLAEYISADLSAKDEQTIANVVYDAVKILGGGLDMLVLNHLSPSEVIVQKDWPAAFSKHGVSWVADQFYLNVFSYMTMAHHALPILEKSNGKLVVVSSMSGLLGLGKTVAYSAQKHALHGYFNGLRSNLNMNKRMNTSITICILGAIGSEALEKGAGNVAKYIPPAPVDDCARNIIAAGQLGQSTLYYPYGATRPASILVNIIPETLQAIVQILLGDD